MESGGLWSKTVSASFGASFSQEGAFLQLHSCVLLKSSSAGPTTLRCTCGGHSDVALARVTAQAPLQKLSGHVTAPCSLRVTGPGELLVKGRIIEISAVGAELPKMPRKRKLDTAQPPPRQVDIIPVAKSPQNTVAKSPQNTVAKSPQNTVAKSPQKRPRIETPDTKVSSAAATVVGAAPSKGKAKPLVPLHRRCLNSGLQYEILQNGTGTYATLGRQVEVKYEGFLASSGKKFQEGSMTFMLGFGEVMKGWDDGIKGMLKGEHRRLHVPARLAYGRGGSLPTIPPNSALTFEIEVVNC